MPNSDRFLTLSTVAEAYYFLGYSLIPLLGDTDPSRPKVPAIPWATFQQRHSTPHDHQYWFGQAGFAGLGIVTGSVSRLVVLDFDTEEVFKDFRRQYPDLTETHTVQSAGRGLPHLYFRLPDHLHIESQKRAGADLLSTGRYVVAPPTSINGQSYRITRGSQPKPLTERDIRRLQAFMASNTLNGGNPLKLSLQKPPLSSSVQSEPPKVSPQDLTNLYQYFCKQGGRNNALFRTSLRARDMGWHSAETQNCLVPLHIQQSTTGFHNNEIPQHRQREALKTIESAFSRPARPIKSQTSRQQGYLSNSVREALMQRGMTYVIRTYEGLFNVGVHPGQSITAKNAIKRLTGLVGRDSVVNALKALHNGQPLFAQKPPVNPHYDVATDNSLKTSKKCSFEGGKNQYKPQGGRPEHHYWIPTNEDLCRILGVRVTGSDPLEQTDLASARKTRMALHRELIKRRPGPYPRRWLAQRLGVNTRTLAAYHKQIPIHSRAMFIETPINWKTIERLPFDEPIQGAVLVTQAGKRYPALRTVASRLLAGKESITLKQQTANFYWYGDTEPVAARMRDQQEVQVRQERIETFVAKQAREMPTIQHKLVPQPPVVKQGRGVTKAPTRQDYRKPFKNEAQETLAQQVYATLNTGTNKRLSLQNTRQLVSTYSAENISQTLIVTLQRQSLAYPIGFFITVLRSNLRK